MIEKCSNFDKLCTDRKNIRIIITIWSTDEVFFTTIWSLDEVLSYYWRDILRSHSAWLLTDLMHVLGNFKHPNTISKGSVKTLTLVHAYLAQITANINSRTTFHARVKHPTTVIQNISFSCICVISDTNWNGSISELIQLVTDLFFLFIHLDWTLCF